MPAKRVYLTIDDAPSKDFKIKVDFLFENKISAIFFCIGENLPKYETDVVYAIKKGFMIGNHSYNHKHFSDTTLEEGIASIKKTDEIIEKLYNRSEIHRPFKLFRFPFFDQGGDLSGDAYEGKWSLPENKWFTYERDDKRIAIQAYLKELGYSQPKFEGINMRYFNDKKLLEGADVRCTFDQMEYYLGDVNAPYSMGSVDNILGRINEDIPYQGRSLNCLETSDIILIHDEEKTTELFYRIINRYMEKRFEFLTL